MYENYARIRDAKGVKDSDVARATGISAGTLSDWKHGRYKLKYDKLQKIAEFLGVSTDELTGVKHYEYAVDVKEFEKAAEEFEKAKAAYYSRLSTAKKAQALFEDPGMRALFDAAQDSRPEDLQMAIDLLRRLKQTNPDG